MHNLKLDNCVLFGRLTENYSLEHSLSDSSEGLFQRGREKPGYTSVFAGEKNVVEHQKINANHKKQTSQVYDFSIFLCIGICKNLELLKLFL